MAKIPLEVKSLDCRRYKNRVYLIVKLILEIGDGNEANN
jgi:hypothetical protein